MVYCYTEGVFVCCLHIFLVVKIEAWTLCVFSYAVSLCRCSTVCRRWHQLAADPLLWRQLCARPKWRLSRAAEQKQLLRFISSDGNINVSLYIYSCIGPYYYSYCFYCAHHLQARRI